MQCEQQVLSNVAIQRELRIIVINGAHCSGYVPLFMGHHKLCEYCIFGP